MDELESSSNEKTLSESDTKQMAALSQEVKKSSDFFERVATRIQNINATDKSTKT